MLTGDTGEAWPSLEKLPSTSQRTSSFPDVPQPRALSPEARQDAGSILAGSGTVRSRGEGTRRGFVARGCGSEGPGPTVLLSLRGERTGPERQPWKQQHSPGTARQEARGQEAAWLRNQNKYEGGGLGTSCAFHC